MFLLNFISNLRNKEHKKVFGALDIFRYIGPGFLVTVGFIDPGNWASNIAAGSSFGYELLWVITFSTTMLIILQHNVAHLGIATGLCLSEAATLHMKKWVSRPVIGSSLVAGISTAMAEFLGGAIALNMLFHIPYKTGALIVFITVSILLFTNSYRRLEKIIIGLVSVIGLSFIYELFLVDINWDKAITGWVLPSFPSDSMLIIMSVLGAVVMPHNLFLHSEVIQSRQWNREDPKIIRKQLDYEFFDTLISMIVGFAINSAIVLMAATVFYSKGIVVTEIQQAGEILKPLLGRMASVVFAVALLLSGIASSVTAGMAGGSVFSGLFGEPYNIKDIHTRTGVMLTYILAFIVILFVTNPFMGLIISQVILSVQLPFTVFLQVYLTSSKKVMGVYANKKYFTVILLLIGAFVTFMNVKLLIHLIFGG